MEGFMEVELMVTKRDDNRRPTDRPTDRVNIEQSASGRWTGRVLQKVQLWEGGWVTIAASCPGTAKKKRFIIKRTQRGEVQIKMMQQRRAWRRREPPIHLGEGE